MGRSILGEVKSRNVIKAMDQTSEQKEIITLADIRALVDTFYGSVMKDELLSPIFASKISNSWDRHLDIMYRFWQTVLLEEHTYQGAPFMKHIDLPIGPGHFERWISIFYQTVDSLFVGDKATEAKWRASRMAEMFMYKLDYIQQAKAGSQRPSG